MEWVHAAGIRGSINLRWRSCVGVTNNRELVSWGDPHEGELAIPSVNSPLHVVFSADVSFFTLLADLQ